MSAKRRSERHHLRMENAITVEIATYKDGDICTLHGAVKFPALPRKGEYVTLAGPEFNDERGEPARFLVDDVEWSVGVGPEPQADVTVYVVLPPGECEFKRWCICDPPEPDLEFRCNNCGDKVRQP